MGKQLLRETYDTETGLHRTSWRIEHPTFYEMCYHRQFCGAIYWDEVTMRRSRPLPPHYATRSNLIPRGGQQRPTP
jgi:hypothetical protein